MFRLGFRLILLVLFLAQFYFAVDNLLSEKTITLETSAFERRLEAPGITVCKQGFKGIRHNRTKGDLTIEVVFSW